MKNLFKYIIQLYLKFLVRIVIQRFHPEVIAITGSLYKTTVKNDLSKLLGERFKVRANPRSFNTEIGLPLAVLYLPSGKSSVVEWLKILIQGSFTAFFSKTFPRKLVLEFGVDAPGDMNYLLTLVKPTIAIITTVTDTYIDSFGSRENIAKEYKKILSVLPKNGVAFLYHDDPLVRHMRHACSSRVITYGRTTGADFIVSKVSKEHHQILFHISTDKATAQFRLSQFGESYILSRLISCAVGHEYSFSLKDVRSVFHPHEKKESARQENHVPARV